MKIAIFGAGCIGCFIGGQLLKEHASVTFIGRSHIGNSLTQHGLTISDFQGMHQVIPANTFTFSSAADVLSDCSVILVCVKSQQTEQAAQEILTHQPNALVISLQNGVHNTQKLKDLLPQATVIAGTVQFNVVDLPDGHFHKSTEGEIYLEHHPKTQAIKELFDKALTPVWHDNMRSIQYSKLLINLNNSINAISDVPLKLELEDITYRKLLAASIKEGIAVYESHGIPVSKIGKIPVKWLPILLRLPDALFKVVAKNMLLIDPKARSSMWQDIQKGRRTEVDELNGEIIRLGKDCGIRTPVNSLIYDQIRQLEQEKM